MQLVNSDYPSRMKEILNESWRIFKWQFVNKVFVRDIYNEAPFQPHFASIIRSVGTMYVLHGETFYVDLETRWDGLGSKKKYIDITCGFYELGNVVPQYACAIELKFKRKDYSALPHNMFAIYKDIESLEREVEAKGKIGIDMYSEGHFYFIINNEDYCRKPAYEVKSMSQSGKCDYSPFGLNNGRTCRKIVYHPKKGTDKDRIVELNKDYKISWETYDGSQVDEKWYFLEIDVNR